MGDERNYRICGAGTTTTDWQVLESLLAEPSYQSAPSLPKPSLAGSSRAEYDAFQKALAERDRTHGPYLFDCIALESFEELDASTAGERLMAWGRLDGMRMPPKGVREVERLSEIAEGATGLFWLRDLDAHCVLPWNYFGSWAELVIVDRRRDEVLLVVASAD